jgi:flagellar FliL protein
MNCKPMITSLRRFICLFFILFLAGTPAFAQAAEDEPGAAESQSDDTGDAEGAARQTAYLSLEPSFVTHVGPAGGKLTYLKAEISLRTSSNATLEAAEKHMPRLRHELVTLLGDQTDLDRLTSSDGQQALREEARARINAVLSEQQTGAQIDDVLFTSFVVQR